ncbi:CTTNBP2 N-terminal-like protein isoform X1 [Anopheles aquasalis]|uniref:CTTNBP2 N-terminal-like protein isoform X1 n=1 Tax=Anopheles aquasalis TaxID=42839 RepID=UPI00215B76B7|nr:CTTNBP2 N-terminal-like protein isoform X1 [Anopheles aquasalis]
MAEVGTSSSGDGESGTPADGKQQAAATTTTTTTTTKGTVKFTEADLAAIKQTSDTLKRNPKIDFSKADLLKLLSYLEGELQARDVVIAVLKTEKIKQLLTAPRYGKPTNLNDPHAALFRDQLAASGNIASRQSSMQAAQSEHEMRLMNDQRSGVREQMDSLATLVMQQRQAQAKMIEALKDAEERHKRVVQELYDERRKHEHTTAQGDDITYGLEIERSRLKQELDHEREQHKVLEIELKKVQEQFESEKHRQKQIVLLLLAERKKIIIKYIEERKRSEDLAQILSEEKQRVDTIAEGLEEESKKSLRMEAELEKQAQQFEMERKMLHQSLAKEEKRVKEQDVEIMQLKAEIELLRKQSGIRHPLVAPQLPTKPGGLVPSRPSIGGASTGASPVSVPGSAANAHVGSAGTGAIMAGVLPGQMISSMATKVVQPTATVSSVPVSAPTTGIARSVSPGQLIRQTAISQLSVTSPSLVGGATGAPGSTGSSVAPSAETYANTPTGKMASAGVRKAVGIAAATVIGGGGGASTMGTGMQPPAATTGSTATIKKTIIPPVGGRGVPPPIPPNKPQIPPKLSGVSAVAAVAAGAVSSRIPFLSHGGSGGSSSSSSSSSSGSSTGSIGGSVGTPVSPVGSGISSGGISTFGTTPPSGSNGSATVPIGSSSSGVPSISVANSSSSTASSQSTANIAPNSASVNANALPSHPHHHSQHHPHHPHHHLPPHGGPASSTASLNNVIASPTVTGAGSSVGVGVSAPATAAATPAISAQQQSLTPAGSASSVPSTTGGPPSEILTNVGCEGGIV